MKLIEQVEDLTVTSKSDFSLHSTLEQSSFSSHHFVSQEEIKTLESNSGSLENGLKQRFLEKIQNIISSIKTLITSIRSALGPFSLHKSILQQERDSQTQPTATTDQTTEQKQAETEILSPKSSISISEINVVTPEKVVSRQEVAANLTEVKVSEPVTLKTEASSSLFEDIFNVVEPLKDIYNHYSSALTTYSESLQEKKPLKMAQYTKLLKAYNTSFVTLEEKQQAVKELRNHIQDSVSNDHVSISKMLELEALYASKLLPHAMILTEATEQDTTIQQITEPQNVIAEAKAVFGYFDLKILTKVHTELLRKTYTLFDYPKTRKLYLEALEPLEIAPGTTELQLATLKKFLTLELQSTLFIDEKSYETYIKGRDIIWNWNKYYQIEDFENTKVILDYGLLYIKLVTTLNTRYSAILSESIKHIKSLEKLERKTKISTKK